MSRRVLVTGAASGIGAAAAERMRAKGAKVVGLDLNGDESKDILSCDLSDPEAVERTVPEAIERLGGGVDTLVNNAGLGFSQSAGTEPDPEALKVIDVNLLGPWRGTAAAPPAPPRSPALGRGVNVSSGLAFLAVPAA